MARSPRAVPWESKLPWANLMVLHRAAPVPDRDDRGPGSACAKVVAAITNPGVPTSVTARTPNASVRSAAGRRRGDRPGGVPTMMSKPSTLEHNVRAVSAPHLRRKPRRTPRLRRRVVTRQQFSCHILCATGPAAMTRPGSRAATRHATAVTRAVRRCAECSIANASGGAAALSRAAGHAPRSTLRHGRGGPDSKTTRPARHHPKRLRRDLTHRPCRSAVDSLAPAAA
jgi:hypothetical protein